MRRQNDEGLPTSYWWVSYTNGKGERWAERMISHATASRWKTSLESGDFSRIHLSHKKPRNEISIGRKVHWLTPRGAFASDVIFLKSLGGEYLSFDPDGNGEIQVSFQDLPWDVEARAKTISHLRRLNSAQSFGAGHKAAITEMNRSLQELEIGSLEWLILFDEMKWAVEHPFALSD